MIQDELGPGLPYVMIISMIIISVVIVVVTIVRSKKEG